MTTLVAILDLTTLAAILDLNNFSCFWSTSHHNSSYQVSSQLAFRFRIEVPNRFSRCQFPVNWPYGSAAEVDNRLTRWWPWWPPSISNQNNFNLFLIYKSPQYFQWNFKSTGLSVMVKNLETDIQDGRHGGHVGFTSYQVNWPFHSAEVQNRFSRWLPSSGSHLGFQIGRILAIFDLQAAPILPIKFWVNLPFG